MIGPSFIFCWRKRNPISDELNGGGGALKRKTSPSVTGMPSDSLPNTFPALDRTRWFILIPLTTGRRIAFT